jgi:hypothetical protein
VASIVVGIRRREITLADILLHGDVIRVLCVLGAARSVVTENILWQFNFEGRDNFARRDVLLADWTDCQAASHRVASVYLIYFSLRRVNINGKGGPRKILTFVFGIQVVTLERVPT